MTTSMRSDATPARPIEVLPASDIDATARVLAQAFADNPCYAFMHPRVATRHADLVAFFARDLSWRAPLRLTWVARGPRGDVVATATLQPPGAAPRGGLRVLTHWVWPTLRDQGARTLARIAQADQALTRAQQRVAGRATYWYVHAVAVRPDLQGRAIGSAIMRRLLHELDVRRAPAAPVVLATQRETNLRFYARLGFQLRHQATIGEATGNAGFTSWFMRYAPGAP